jgi:alkylation response protein AidB-like acyl-CoA dehydrogenase
LTYVLALLTEEQRILREVVTDLAARIGLANPADLDTANRTKGWAELGAMGLFGLRLRGADGTPEASGVELMIAAEALATSLVPLPYLGVVVLPGELLALAGAPDDLQAAVADGTQRHCVLLDRSLAGLATAPFDEAVAWDCAGAEFALGVATTATGATLLRFPIRSTTPLDAADLTRSVAQIEVGEPVGEFPLDADDLARWRALALVTTSADIVGALRGGLDVVVEYTKERVQFGVAVGTFQAVQHLCAAALVKLEGSASLIRYAAWAVDELPSEEAQLAAMTAKAYTAGVARDVGEIVMQVYGGIGQTWENIAHFRLRRAMVTAQVLGDDHRQLVDIADVRLGGM